ncbi:MAG: glycoside hydrolase family 16 protein [Promethearchaeota archaeon]
MSTFSQKDFPSNPLEKQGYILEFHDEFNNYSLNMDKWVPYYLPHWSSRVQSAPNYHLDGNNLILQIKKEQQPWCPEFDGEVRCSSIQTGEFAGPIGSKIGQHRFSDVLMVREAQENVRKYTPQYGYFEVRAKGLKSSANHVSLWMIGYEDTPEKSSEIAIFEQVGSHSSSSSTGIRYGVHPWGDPNIVDEFYEDFMNINPLQYHLYAVEWTPTYLDFFFDNELIRTIKQSPNYPMQFMLSIYELRFEGAWTGPYDPKRPYPISFTIDYFRAYRPKDNYGIKHKENEK